MNVAEWIIVAILSMTLMVFLIVGIVLLVKLIGLSKSLEQVVVEGKDVVRNANGVVSNVKGMTSIGGAVEMLVDKYVVPKLNNSGKDKNKTKDKEKEAKDGNKKAK